MSQNKKFYTVLLVIVLLALSLSACGGDDVVSTGNQTGSAVQSGSEALQNLQDVAQDAVDSVDPDGLLDSVTDTVSDAARSLPTLDPADLGKAACEVNVTCENK